MSALAQFIVASVCLMPVLVLCAAIVLIGAGAKGVRK